MLNDIFQLIFKRIDMEKANRSLVNYIEIKKPELTDSQFVKVLVQLHLNS